MLNNLVANALPNNSTTVQQPQQAPSHGFATVMPPPANAPVAPFMLNMHSMQPAQPISMQQMPGNYGPFSTAPPPPPGFNNPPWSNNRRGGGAPGGPICFTTGIPVKDCNCGRQWCANHYSKMAPTTSTAIERAVSGCCRPHASHGGGQTAAREPPRDAHGVGSWPSTARAG